MTDRVELLEATLDSLPQGIALLGGQCEVVFWNQAANAITGHAAMDIVGRAAPESLRPLLNWCAPAAESELNADPHAGRGFLVHARHKLGHDVSAMVRILVLRDGMGRRIGAAVLFHQ